MRAHPLLLALLLAATAAQATPAPRADAEIRHLLDFVAASDCAFIRNGDVHAARDASAHLAMKYGKAKSRLDSAEQFIEHVASKSYFTGREYQVRCPGLTARASGPWLGAELTRWRQSVSAAAQAGAR